MLAKSLLGYNDDDDDVAILLLVSNIRLVVQEQFYLCPMGHQMFSSENNVGLRL